MFKKQQIIRKNLTNNSNSSSSGSNNQAYYWSSIGKNFKSQEKYINNNNNNNELLSSHGKNGCWDERGGESSLDGTTDRKEFSSSTPTKEVGYRTTNDNNRRMMSLGEEEMSPILKENIFGKKSKMTSEEIFAAIHKSKKKLNMKDVENRCQSPTCWTNPDIGGNKILATKSRERSSWSPNTSEDLDYKINEARNRKSWIGTNGGGGTNGTNSNSTPINSFKKLLLQQGSKNSPSKDLRISAVEQLKLSKNGNGNVESSSTSSSLTSSSNRRDVNKSPSRTVGGNRNKYLWKFSSPRSDVLSSTILEDCSEVEKSDDADHDVIGINNNNNKDETPRWVRSKGLDFVKTNIRDGKFDDEMMTSRQTGESKSLEITKKYLQQARRNFFNGQTASQSFLTKNSVGLPRLPVPEGSSDDEINSKGKNFFFNSIKSNHNNNNHNNHNNVKIINSSLVNSEKKKNQIISLETAL